MTIKSPRSVAGLALALLLALFGGVTATAGGGGITETPAEDAPEGRVIAASAREASAPVLADLDGLDFDPTTTTATAVPADVAAAGEPAAEPVGEAAPVEAAPTTTAPAPAPAPTPQPTPVPAPTSVEAIIESYFGPNTPKALAVARCESGLNPNAMSPGGGNHGLFQINNVHSGNFQAVTGAPWSARYDVHANTAFAKWLFDQSGWGPWACA